VFSNPPSRPLPFGRNETLTRPRDSRSLALADSYCSVSPKLLNLRCVSPLNHFVPFVSQGGWGWLVVGAAFLVQVLTTGLQFAFGVMATQIVKHFRRESTVEIGQFWDFEKIQSDPEPLRS